MSNVKLSQIASGSAFVVATDNIVTVRSGTTDVLTTLGTASTVNIGTSGGTVPLLNGNIIFSGIVTLNNTFSMVTPSGQFVVYGGANSGTIDNIYIGSSAPSTGAFTTLSANSTVNFSGLTVSSAVATDASNNLVSVTNTGSGNNVLATSPILVTPALGTPSALVGTNITGTAAGLTAGTATALATGRTINGITFDGTSNITVTAAAGTLTGTTLASNVVTSSLTTVGTIGTGVWNGTKIGLAYGGTNADLSATGGTSQVLKQISVGAAVTVAQLAFTDISGSATTAQLSTNSTKRDITFNIDGQGSAIASGGTWYLSNVNYNGTITGWNIVADQSGSIVIDVWKLNAAVPTVANTITASSLPTLTSSQSSFAGSISGWTTSILAADVFAFHINSASTITKANLTLTVTIT